jgi:hypothetical protein
VDVDMIQPNNYSRFFFKYFLEQQTSRDKEQNNLDLQQVQAALWLV